MERHGNALKWGRSRADGSLRGTSVIELMVNLAILWQAETEKNLRNIWEGISVGLAVRREGEMCQGRSLGLFPGDLDERKSLTCRDSL